LAVAAARGSAELVTLLLDRGAGIRGPDKFGGTPLFAAAKQGHVHIVRLLLDRGAPVDQRAPLNGATPLRAAVDRDDPIIADMLLAAGADSHATDEQGLAPIEHSTPGNLKLVLWRWERQRAPRP
jgi:ankyrin repeat protein